MEKNVHYADRDNIYHYAVTDWEDEDPAIMLKSRMHGESELLRVKKEDVSKKILIAVFCAILLPVASVYTYHSQSAASISSVSADMKASDEAFDLWNDADRPFPVYSLSYERQSLPVPQIQTRISGKGEQEDRYYFNEIGKSPHFFISITSSEAPLDERSFYIVTVLKAAANGIAVSNSFQPEGTETKFGMMELADALLEKEGKHECVLFRYHTEDRHWGFTGWFCDSEKKSAEKKAIVSSLVNSLELTDDPEFDHLRGYIPDHSGSAS